MSELTLVPTFGKDEVVAICHEIPNHYIRFEDGYIQLINITTRDVIHEINAEGGVGSNANGYIYLSYWDTGEVCRAVANPTTYQLELEFVASGLRRESTVREVKANTIIASRQFSDNSHYHYAAYRILHDQRAELIVGNNEPSPYTVLGEGLIGMLRETGLVAYAHRHGAVVRTMDVSPDPLMAVGSECVYLERVLDSEKSTLVMYPIQNIAGMGEGPLTSPKLNYIRKVDKKSILTFCTPLGDVIYITRKPESFAYGGQHFQLETEAPHLGKYHTNQFNNLIHIQ